MAKLVIRHDLHAMSESELKQYLRDVSEFIGLDPDLNALDAIFMPNEGGVGQSKVVYMRRGTAEILRNARGIEVDTLTSEVIDGSIVYTAKGHDKSGRHEVAIGSKYIAGLLGKAKDDAIMTASTRALRRLTAQFTTLGLLDESEVQAAKDAAVSTPNPAGAATLAPNSTPAIFSVPTVPANNAPGKPVDPKPVEMPAPEAPVTQGEQFLGRPEQIAAVWKQVEDKEADKKPVEMPVTPAESPVAPVAEPVIEAVKPPTKRTRKSKNTVTLDVEAEVVTKSASADTSTKSPIADIQSTPATPAEQATLVDRFAKGKPAGSGIYTPATGEVTHVTVPTQANPAVPTQADVVAPGMPNKDQMTEYRKRIGAFTQQIEAEPNMSPVDKMRAFMTRYTGNPPQQMSVSQYEEFIRWLEDFAGRNGIAGLKKYINDSLGIKK